MRLILAAIISFFSFQIVAQETEINSSFETYTNEKSGYSIDYPCDWTKKEDHRGFDLFLMAPKGDEKSPANFSIITGELPKGVTLDTYTKENIKNLFSGNSTIKIQDSGVKQIDGVPAFWIRYTRDDQKTTVVHYFLIADSKAYLFTGGASQEDFDRMQPTFDKIVESFAIKKKT